MSNSVIPNGWNQWSKHILAELERLNSCYKTLDEKVQQIREDIAMLKVKSGVWGIVGGSIPVIIWILLRLFEHSQGL